ncbi:hypothetical protein KIPB_004829 [Kipferlia bialata]|uniref:Uncharacterized protein n=1 Tax=Kipferlia bialata TaxID=797122 RepID=A0A9K3CW40_9EUKA|nr:hypothetical protein KIPB_004829 [Kipferlia bialata]|eukprot:g4829.t1
MSTFTGVIVAAYFFWPSEVYGFFGDPTFTFLTSGVTVLMTMPLCLIFIQVFRGLRSTRTFRRITRTSTAVCAVLAVVTVTLFVWDFTWVKEHETDTQEALDTHMNQVSALYQILGTLQIMHLSVILVVMVAMRRRSTKRVSKIVLSTTRSDTDETSHRRQKVSKVYALPVFILTYGGSKLIYFLIRMEWWVPSQEVKSLSNICMNTMEYVSLMLLVYPERKAAVYVPSVSHMGVQQTIV